MGEYTIKGGDQGRHRLEILTRTLSVETKRFLSKCSELEKSNCLDLGCGAGAVSFQLLEFVGGEGTVLGLDFDAVKIAHAQSVADSKGWSNISFKEEDVYGIAFHSEFEVVYSRFLLSHLSQPKKILSNMHSALKNDGVLLIEDTDFSGHFSYPPNRSFDQYVTWYQDLLHIRGGNADRGPELYNMLKEAGFRDISFEVRQPVHLAGEGKLMAEITLEAISGALIEEGICSEDEVQRESTLLQAFRRSNESMLSLPRIFQYKARK